MKRVPTFLYQNLTNCLTHILYQMPDYVSFNQIECMTDDQFYERRSVWLPSYGLDGQAQVNCFIRHAMRLYETEKNIAKLLIKLLIKLQVPHYTRVRAYNIIKTYLK